MKICLAGLDNIGKILLKRLDKYIVATSCLYYKPIYNKPFYNNPIEMINNHNPDILIETIGGNQVIGLHNKAHQLGINIITNNSQLLAENPYFLDKVNFEAAISGGIPSVDILKNFINKGNPVRKIEACLNVETNNLIYKMNRQNLTLNKIELDGTKTYSSNKKNINMFLEKDLGHKIYILASIAFNKYPDLIEIKKQKDNNNTDIKIISTAEKIGGLIKCTLEAKYDYNFDCLNNNENAIKLIGKHGNLFLKSDGYNSESFANNIIYDVFSIAEKQNLHWDDNISI